MKKIYSILLISIITIAILSICFYFYQKKATNGTIMLIEFEKIEGVLNWERELDSKGIGALVKVQDNVLKEYPDVFKRLANKGYEIAGGYDSEPFWDMPYEKQYQYMKESQEFIYSITGKKMKVFGSKYFAYDENTLKVADALGIEYILARGTQGVKAVIYAPEEYKVKIISVSNIVFEDMGSGSLCDYSLWARGADASDFQKVINENLSKNADNLILVSHAYLGGTRIEWWNVYLNALNSGKVAWTSFDSWISKVKTSSMPNKDIPINKEVKYVVPTPAKAIEDFEPIPNLDKLLEEEEFCPVCY
ncbi:MAG: polysaccharide deacetylase family protein [Candidatus Paceibacterota bacterium]